MTISITCSVSLSCADLSALLNFCWSSSSCCWWLLFSWFSSAASLSFSAFTSCWDNWGYDLRYVQQRFIGPPLFLAIPKKRSHLENGRTRSGKTTLAITVLSSGASSQKKVSCGGGIQDLGSHEQSCLLYHKICCERSTPFTWRCGLLSR